MAPRSTPDIPCMRSIHNQNAADQMDAQKRETTERRRHGRVRVDETDCGALGRVLDISASGVRVARRRAKPLPEGMTFNIRLSHGDTSVILPAKVVRVDKRPGLGTVHALTFVALSEPQRRQLNRMVASAWSMLTVVAA